MKDMNKIAKITMYVSVFGLETGVAFQGASYMGEYNRQNKVSEVDDVEGQEVPETNVIPLSVVSTSGSDFSSYNNVTEIAEAVLPSIVAINVTETIQGNYFGQVYEQESSGSGSGIIIAEKDGTILIATNNHVVSGADNVTIEFADGTTANAEVRGTDSDNDLAVVTVDRTSLSADTISNIKIATLGDSDKAVVGEMVVAIGNALGYGQSVTVGYISAKDRQIDMEDGSMTLLQTDAAINPGNSGGALVNMRGEVVGINSAKFASEEIEGMGFSIPITYGIPIINNLMNKEMIPESEQAYLGISGEDIQGDYSKIYNLPEGILVREVTQGSPAQKAGIIAGMMIIRMDEKEVSSMEGLQSILATKRSGDEITITVVRGDMGRYVEDELKITLGSKDEKDS